MTNVNYNINFELDSIRKQQEEMETESSNSILQESQTKNNISGANKIDNSQEANLVSTDFFESTIFYILVAVSMGALGSAVSIIVRYNKFIEQSKEGESDLFFTGFFRPIVGMSFAIFAVVRFKPFLCQKIKPYLDRSKRNTRVFKLQ
ncbi:MAG: hypothetical protein MJK14_06220, partial [Rivularia sp. ALOHA_DT_140]|nr:hypothetical protein [Rivularia sp. ALOHA_DT_140]